MIKVENGLKKHVRNIPRISHGYVELVVIVFTLNTRYDYVILYFRDVQHELCSRSVRKF